MLLDKEKALTQQLTIIPYFVNVRFLQEIVYAPGLCIISIVSFSYYRSRDVHFSNNKYFNNSNNLLLDARNSCQSVDLFNTITWFLMVFSDDLL